MSLKNRNAAVLLAQAKNHRSAVSRAYYAAFSAITCELRKYTLEFENGNEHPPHRQIGRFIKKYFVGLSRAERDDLRDVLARLYQARIDADYRHEAEFSDEVARLALSDMEYVLESLELVP
ncbi:MAG: HEPN domain-containing protein [Phycisphaerales bacterium]|nr:HEPN domain-containing protein [Phycisphaerales bacterium]